MGLKRAVSVYSMVIGVSMIGMWIFFYLIGGIPELETEPIRISMHIIAEGLTAILLILGGYGVLTGKGWGEKMYFLSMGMLIYTLIQSPGYFMETRDYGLVLMFGVMLLVAMGMILKMLPSKQV